MNAITTHNWLKCSSRKLADVQVEATSPNITIPSAILLHKAVTLLLKEGLINDIST